MSWLSKATEERLASLPRPALAPSLLFDFEDVRGAIVMVEQSIIKKQDVVEKAALELAMKAAQNPNHSFAREPVFAPMASAMWKSALTFPRILRGAMLIAICSHVEHALRQWCALLEREWSPLPVIPAKTRRESDVAYCMRFLRDAAGLSVGGFEDWDEWRAIDAYRAARNCLAHDGGLVTQEGDAGKIDRLPGVKVETFGLLADGPAIYLDIGACEAAATTARAFFDRLTTICQQDARACPPDVDRPPTDDAVR